jgi:hypothetical protein
MILPQELGSFSSSPKGLLHQSLKILLQLAQTGGHGLLEGFDLLDTVSESLLKISPHQHRLSKILPNDKQIGIPKDFTHQSALTAPNNA